MLNYGILKSHDYQKHLKLNFSGSEIFSQRWYIMLAGMSSLTSEAVPLADGSFMVAKSALIYFFF